MATCGSRTDHFSHIEIILETESAVKIDLHPKSWTKQPTIKVQIFMGKHYTIAFKLQVLQPILKGKMSIREAARFYNIPSDTLVGTWLKRFEKSGIKGLIPYKPSGRPPMKPKYARMPPPPKTEEDRLRLRILQLEAEVAYLKELRKLRLQEEARQRKLSKS